MGTVVLCSARDAVVRAEDGDGGWRTERVLEGSVVNCLAGDPFDENGVYAGTQGDGLLRSDDRGRTWRPLGPPGEIVKAVAPSPHDPAVVWIGTKPARVAVSRDGGGSWEQLAPFPGWRSWFWMTPAERPVRQPYVQGLGESPSEPGVLVAGIEFGALVCSEDGGRSWSGHRRGASRDCHMLAFHPHGSWVYEGGGTGPAVSRDGGRTWAKQLEGLDRRYCWAVAADPERPERWYVSAAPGPGKAHVPGKAEARIFRSTGDGFEPLGGGLPEPLRSMPYGLAAPAPGELWAGLAEGAIWRSADYGERWERLEVDLGQVVRAFVLLPDRD